MGSMRGPHSRRSWGALHARRSYRSARRLPQSGLTPEQRSMLLMRGDNGAESRREDGPPRSAFATAYATGPGRPSTWSARVRHGWRRQDSTPGHARSRRPGSEVPRSPGARSAFAPHSRPGSDARQTGCCSLTNDPFSVSAQRWQYQTLMPCCSELAQGLSLRARSLPPGGRAYSGQGNQPAADMW